MAPVPAQAGTGANLSGPDPVGRWRDLSRLRGVHRRYYRRVIECQDGLVQVSPYLANLGEPELADGLAPPVRQCRSWSRTATVSTRTSASWSRCPRHCAARQPWQADPAGLPSGQVITLT
jgi:hypothetical protein